jgi:cold shock CspA family protein
MAGSSLPRARNPRFASSRSITSHRTEWTRNAARRRQILPRRQGYGFIERDQGGDLFVHISEVDENFDTLAKGQRVSFEEGASRRTGKLEAKNVTVIEASVERVRRYG